MGALLGGYLGKEYNKLVRCVGTSIIGAFLLVRGVSMYVGGWPTDAALEAGFAN